MKEKDSQAPQTSETFAVMFPWVRKVEWGGWREPWDVSIPSGSTDAQAYHTRSTVPLGAWANPASWAPMASHARLAPITGYSRIHALSFHGSPPSRELHPDSHLW